MSPSKRAFDLSCAVAGLALLAPVFALVGLAIKLDDGGPVFFRQVRVGRGGAKFRIWKFRSMVPDAERLGRQLTIGRDARVTRVGRWLRRSKLDELPQLLNVLAGEMSMVGPRPEVPYYVEKYSAEQRRVLELCPGITDPASIHYRGEAEVLAASPDPELLYVSGIMPEKIRINLEYAEQATGWTDFLVTLRTVCAVSIPRWNAGRGLARNRNV
jgi:lipopolysaccharide/colanic/teichoic acid biosynthesis glycosyltransferase